LNDPSVELTSAAYFAITISSVSSRFWGASFSASTGAFIAESILNWVAQDNLAVDCPSK